jgi:hypothetical protein
MSQVRSLVRYVRYLIFCYIQNPLRIFCLSRLSLSPSTPPFLTQPTQGATVATDAIPLSTEVLSVLVAPFFSLTAMGSQATWSQLDMMVHLLVQSQSPSLDTPHLRSARYVQALMGLLALDRLYVQSRLNAILNPQPTAAPTQSTHTIMPQPQPNFLQAAIVQSTPVVPDTAAGFFQDRSGGPSNSNYILIVSMQCNSMEQLLHGTRTLIRGGCSLDLRVTGTNLRSHPIIFKYLKCQCDTFTARLVFDAEDCVGWAEKRNVIDNVHDPALLEDTPWDPTSKPPTLNEKHKKIMREFLFTNASAPQGGSTSSM